MPHASICTWQTFIGGSAIARLRNADAYFPTVIDAIVQAKTSVNAETCIFADAAVGAGVAKALVATARRGIDGSTGIAANAARSARWQLPIITCK